MARVNTTVVVTDGVNTQVLLAGDEIPEWAEVTNPEVLDQDPNNEPEETKAKPRTRTRAKA